MIILAEILAMKSLLFAAISCCMLASCYNYRIFPTKNAAVKTDMPRKKAFILNPQLKREYSIFYKSNLFDIVNDSTDGAVVKIELYPMESNVKCSGAMPITVLALGQVPQTFRDYYSFKFAEITGQGIDQKEIKLCIGEQFWFWHLFVFRKNFEGKAGKLLNMEYK
jgi:hypothetical protein